MPPAASKSGAKKRPVLDPIQGGLFESRLRPEDPSNLPAFDSAWTKELRRRHKAVQNDDMGLMESAFKFLTRAKPDPEVSGYEVARWHLTKSVKEQADKLSEAPANGLARSALVMSILQSRREFQPENFRTLLLQATVACYFDRITLKMVGATLFAQSQYLSSFIAASRTKVQKAQKLLEGGGSLDRNEEGRSNMLKILRDLKQTHALAGVMKKRTATALGLHNMGVELALMRNPGKSKSDGSPELDEAKRLTKVVLAAQALPLLNPVLLEYCDAFIKRYPSSSVGPYFKGRILFSGCMLDADKFEAGFRQPEIVKSFQDSFKVAYTSYGESIKLVGTPTTQADRTIVVDWVKMLLYFQTTSKNLFDLKLPRPWLESSFTSADRALQQLPEDNKARSLRNKIAIIQENGY